MNEYSVFWIKKEFAQHFFHKTDILYRFIKSYQHNIKRQDLSQQFNFVTMKFPKYHLINHIQENLLPQMNIAIHNRQIELSKNGYFLTLHIHEKFLKFYCETLSEAEFLLFPILRSYHPYLFVMENNLNNYGWIAPILKKDLNKNSQILYSYH